jgi:hypothetical protein
MSPTSLVLNYEKSVYLQVLVGLTARAGSTPVFGNSHLKSVGLAHFDLRPHCTGNGICVGIMMTFLTTQSRLDCTTFDGCARRAKIRIPLEPHVRSGDR